MSPAGWSECNSTSLLGPVCISSQKPRDKAEERQDEKQTGWVICLVMHVYFTMIAYFSTPGILYWPASRIKNYPLACSKQYIILAEHIHWKRGCAGVLCKRLWREIRLFCIQRVRSWCLWGLHQSTGLTPALPNRASSAMSSGDSPPVPAPSDHLQGTADRDTPERSHHLPTNS